MDSMSCVVTRLRKTDRLRISTRIEAQLKLTASGMQGHAFWHAGACRKFVGARMPWVRRETQRAVWKSAASWALGSSE